MKTQMRFQKYICLAALLAGVLGLLYAFFYCTGALAELGQTFTSVGGVRVSRFTAAEGKYDATLYDDIQGFNNALMYCGIVMILLGVLLYITACHKRRNYYISNYVAIGACAGGNIVISLVLLILNGIWRGKFLQVDFDAWYKVYERYITNGDWESVHYSDSTAWFDVGFAVYIIIILVSVALILNLIWKIKLMQGEKRLLEGAVAGGAAV